MSSNKIYIGNLSWGVTESMLNDTFGTCGQITECNLVTDRETGRSRGFAFVTYSNENEAQEAVEKYDGQDLDGRNLKVNFANQGQGGRGGRGGPRRGGQGHGGNGGGNHRGDRY